MHHPLARLIVEMDASDVGYGGILKQNFFGKEQIEWFHSGIWTGPQENYSTVKKKFYLLSYALKNYQDDLCNKLFLLWVNCKSAKEILQKDVQKSSLQTNL